MMRIVMVLAAALAASACSTTYEAAADCRRTAACTSGFPTLGYGPIHAQAVAPPPAGRWTPQR